VLKLRRKRPVALRVVQEQRQKQVVQVHPLKEKPVVHPKHLQPPMQATPDAQVMDMLNPLPHLTAKSRKAVEKENNYSFTFQKPPKFSGAFLFSETDKTHRPLIGYIEEERPE
jgi:hypothetical protein